MDWTAILVAGGSLLITGIGVVLWFLYLSVRDDAKTANAAVIKNAIEADKKCDTISRELADYKLYAEQRFVTQGALTQTIDGLNRAIESLTTSIRDMSTSFSAKLDSLHQRLDSKADKP
jgi:flagellar capping protein FliD